MVMRDAKEPRREGHVFPAKVAYCPEHLQEDLLRQIFCVRSIAEASHGVAVDAGHVAVVEVGESLLVACAGAVHDIALGVQQDTRKRRDLHPEFLIG